jgi:hypothetical protein
MTSIALRQYRYLEPMSEAYKASTQSSQTVIFGLMGYLADQLALSQRNDSPTLVGYIARDGISAAESVQDEADLLAIQQSLREIEDDPSVLISGDELRNRLSQFLD